MRTARSMRSSTRLTARSTASSSISTRGWRAWKSTTAAVSCACANDRLVVRRSLPAGSLRRRAGDRLHLVGQVEHAAAARQRLLAGVAQADAARRAVQQPRTEPLLEALEVAADHRARHAPAARRGLRQAAAVGDLDEDAHRGQSVHRIRSIRFDNLSTETEFICGTVNQYSRRHRTTSRSTDHVHAHASSPASCPAAAGLGVVAGDGRARRPPAAPLTLQVYNADAGQLPRQRRAGLAARPTPC